MTRFLKNRVVLFVIAAWFAYWPVAYIVPRPLLLEFINGMIAALSLGLVMAYTPGAWKALRTRPYRLSGGHLLILGVTLVQAAITSIFTWGWFYRIFDKPQWMEDHAIRGWLVYLIFIGGVLHLMAGDVNSDSSFPTKGWLHLSATVAAGFGLAVIMILTLGARTS